jgi:hypothetical protein
MISCSIGNYQTNPRCRDRRFQDLRLSWERRLQTAATVFLPNEPITATEWLIQLPALCAFAALRENSLRLWNSCGFLRNEPNDVNLRFQDFRFEIESGSAVIDRRYSERKASPHSCWFVYIRGSNEDFQTNPFCLMKPP